jgi:PAS domain S-box-containing protein
MNDATHQLMEQYTAALQDYLAGKGEAALLRVYELGRSAIANKLNVLEMVAIHQEALMAVLLERLATEESARIAQGAVDLLAESLAPFELVQRSSQEGKALLHHLNAVLERQVAERTEALRQAEEKYHSIFANTVEGIFQSTLDGRFITANPALARIHGYESPEDMIAAITDIEHQLYVDPHRRAEFTRVLQEHGTVAEFESQVYRKDGTIIWIAENARAIRDASGTVVGYEGTVVDITERKRVERRLATQHATTRVLAESATLGQATPKILQTICESLGWDLGELWSVDQPANVLRCVEVWHAPAVKVPKFAAVTRQITFPPGVGLPGSVWASGEPAWIADVTQSANFPRAAIAAQEGLHGGFAFPIRLGGETLAVMAFFSRAIRQPDSELLQMFGVIGSQIGQFIQRKRAEEELRRERDFAKSLIETTQDAVVSIDRHGCIVLFNPAAERIFGYSTAEVLGQKVNLLMPEPYASEHDGYIARYEQTGDPRVIGRIRTLAARRKNGEIFPIELSLTELGADEKARYGAFVRDISKTVRLQEQLIERERLAAIGTTAATFAHEVGNPLNSMYTTVQLLERRLARQGVLVDDKVVTPLRNLLSEMKRLTALLEEFRALARRQKLTPRPTSLATLVAGLLAVESPLYASQGIEVEQVFPPDLPPVVADAEKLKQVLLNLCKNAVEAMPQGGKLTVQAQNSGRQVRLEVSDTGVGIPAGVDIFAPFTTTKPQGTGLGLTIVRQIVAAHRGMLTYHSVPGQGTTFTLLLPISQGAEE